MDILFNKEYYYMYDCIFCDIFQMLWFARELVRSAAPGADSVIHSLIRQVAGLMICMMYCIIAYISLYLFFFKLSGGDVSQKNIFLTESLLDIFVENK